MKNEKSKGANDKPSVNGFAANGKTAAEQVAMLPQTTETSPVETVTEPKETAKPVQVMQTDKPEAPVAALIPSLRIENAIEKVNNITNEINKRKQLLLTRENFVEFEQRTNEEGENVWIQLSAKGIPEFKTQNPEIARLVVEVVKALCENKAQELEISIISQTA